MPLTLNDDYANNEEDDDDYVGQEVKQVASEYSRFSQSSATQPQSRNQSQVKRQSAQPQSQMKGKKMASNQTQETSEFSLEEEVIKLGKNTKFSKEQLLSMWHQYFLAYPEEMRRMAFLRKNNPNEFRALLSNLPGAANRHRSETLYFICACVGAGSVLLFAIVTLTGALDIQRGWNYAKSKNAIPSIVEAIYK